MRVVRRELFQILSGSTATRALNEFGAAGVSISFGATIALTRLRIIDFDPDGFGQSETIAAPLSPSNTLTIAPTIVSPIYNGGLALTNLGPGTANVYVDFLDSPPPAMTGRWGLIDSTSALLAGGSATIATDLATGRSVITSVFMKTTRAGHLALLAGSSTGTQFGPLTLLQEVTVTGGSQAITNPFVVPIITFTVVNDDGALANTIDVIAFCRAGM